MWIFVTKARFRAQSLALQRRPRNHISKKITEYQKAWSLCNNSLGCFRSARRRRLSHSRLFANPDNKCPGNLSNRDSKRHARR